MEEEIISLLNYFSDLTQKTLSLFHLTGVENESDLDMNELIRLIKNNTKRKLISAKLNSDNITYTRTFNDGYTDVVKFNELKNPSFFKLSEDNEKISKILEKEHSPILSFKLSKEPTFVIDKPIESAIEKIFFI